jgi:hypothetical protein
MKTPDDFHEICRRHLDHDLPLPAKPPVGSKLFCGFETLGASTSLASHRPPA